MAPLFANVVACHLRVRGVVQGVGFRPHVWRLARALNLEGWVCNDAEGVLIALSGLPANINEFIRRLSLEAPELARIDAIERNAGEDIYTGKGFVIRESQAGTVRTSIGADAATCDNCLKEIFDPTDRRYRYAFTTCTHCGPRYTIARRLPYDRASTSLAPFPLCAPCAEEYGDPANRRFHAESTCCVTCGPQLALHTIDGVRIPGDPVAETLRRLLAGEIVAIKGLGGFHLACDARNAPAVARLRERKAREAKPFAVMSVSPAVLAEWVTVTEADQVWLNSTAAPLVLLNKKARAEEFLPGVASGVGALGVMRPSTPLQWLIFHEAAGRPAGLDWIEESPPSLVLVMTSANPQGEPLVIDDDEAMARLQGIADAVLGHNREIVARADDSVMRSGVFIRRGRGFTPQAIKLPKAGPSVLAFGGWFKNTICVTRGDEAFVSTHIGDLDNAAACRFLDETVARMLALTEITPEIVAHDRHPDFYSTQAARRFAIEHGLPTVAVQHHHAHLAAVAAEHGITTSAVGLALDGIGLGDDGAAWGGELMRIESSSFTRLGHLAPLPMPGGDRAAREPWRMGAAALWACGRGDEIAARFADLAGAHVIHQMLDRGLNCPETSSAGRLFDAAAGLLGIQPIAQFEAQAAMRLEALADQYGPCDPLSNGWQLRDGVLDLRPLLAQLINETDPLRGAAQFHATLGAALADWAVKVALSDKNCRLLGAGGCWLNRRLVRELKQALPRSVSVLEAHQVPPGDGGLALGQAWVAQNAFRAN